MDARDWPGNTAGHRRASKKAWRKKTGKAALRAWKGPRRPKKRHSHFGYKLKPVWASKHPRIHKRFAKRAWKRKASAARGRAWRR